MLNFENFLITNNLLLLFIVLTINYLILSRRQLIALKLKLNDYPDKRKIHSTPTPLLGGICLFITIITVNYFLYLYGEINFKNLLIIYILYTIFFSVGLLDDIQALSPKFKACIVIFALIVLLVINDEYLINNLQFKYSDRQIDLNIFAHLFTIFCFFSLYNAFNFIDGYNGVSISISIYWSLFIVIQNPNILYLMTIVTLLIIFIYNIEGKIFLGNSGTSFLSIFFGISLIGDYNFFKSIYADEILFLLFIPGVDMIRVTIERIFKKKKVYSADKLHLHHYLIKNKFSNIWQIILGLTMCPYIILRLVANTELTLIISSILYLVVYIFLKKND